MTKAIEPAKAYPFGEYMPNYGDLIVIEPPPEQLTAPFVTVFDRNTYWMDGSVFYLLKEGEVK